MTDLRPEEDEAQRFFELFGLSVTPICTGPARTPDLQVDGDGRGYLVEVKRRTDSDDFARALRDLGDGEQLRPVGHDPAVERPIRKAGRQLQQRDPEHRRLWFVWITIDLHAGGDVGLQMVVGTLHGLKQAIIPVGDGATAISVECYYALPGVFERCPEIDAAIVSMPEGFCLCVNECSPRAAEIVASRVGRRLAERRAVVVPSQREAAGQCFVANRDLDRRDEAAVVSDLRLRYGRPIFCLAEPKHLTAFTHVPS